MDFDPVSYVMGQKASGGGSSTLSGLTDVNISNPTNGQTLVYNAISGKWENGESAGGGVLVVHDVEETLDKTWQEIHDADFAVIKASYNDDGQSLTQPVISVYENDGAYYVAVISWVYEGPIALEQYVADSPSEYPIYD